MEIVRNTSEGGMVVSGTIRTKVEYEFSSDRIALAKASARERGCDTHRVLSEWFKTESERAIRKAGFDLA